MPQLKSAQIKAYLKSVPKWTKRAQAIHRTFEFEDFPGAIKFVNGVAKMAEKARHHPDIDIRWNKVKLTLTTHDEGGITEKDFSLARECDGIFS